ncbi:MAG: hypothetical protein HYU99_06930, partial [Deltaproteobacteria bacterium]|nr:hypothetical protein [Deltaproteobacteria bacterium]
MPGSKVTTDHQQPAAEEALTDEGLVSLYSETESALQRETPPLEPVIDELCALLGPHVNNLVRNQNGAIDLTRVPAENFLEFRQFLVDQAGVNDGILFGSPYSELVAKKDHEILFQLLYREINSDYHISRDGKLLKITGYYAEHLLYEFKKELIEIDAEAFAKNHLSSEEGRRRLAGVFDEYAYDELKINLAKGIARAGKGVVDEYQADLVDEQVGGWNYFNIGVTDRELEGAVKGASAITRSADRVYADVERRQRESVEEPEKIVAPSFDPSIDSTTIAHFARLAEFKLGQPDPVSRLQGRLARLWLWAADDNNWGRLQGGYEREEVNEARAYVLENATEFIQRADLIGSEEFLETFNDKLQDFLRGPIDSSLWDKAADLTVGAGLDSLVQNMLAPLRAPFDDLLRFSDEIKFSQEMGEKIFSPLPRGLSAGHLAEAGVGGRVAAQFIDGLPETKRSLWYSYKQHKFISRAISNTASLFNRGDIVDIERANALIDEWIDALSRVPTEEMIGQTIEEVFRSLSEGGALYTALVASEMEGIEQTLGLLQTTLILVATSIATSGVAAAAGIAARMAMTGKDLQAARAALLAARTASATVETVDKADSVLKRMGKAFGYGAYISTAENAIAVGTGEVRGQPDTLVSWGKDALSTGLSMAVTGALPVSHGGHNNVIGNLFARYTVGGVRGVAYLGMDAGVETVEEGIDQYVRQTLDGNATALSGKQWRELALLSSAGGFAKVGTVAEMIRGKPRTAVRVEDGEPSLPPNDRDNVLQFPRSDGAGGGGWSPDSITEDHEFEDNESSPDEAPGKPDDLAGVKSADDAYGKRVDKAPDRPKRLNCILLLASRQEKYQRGSRERFKAFVSKLDAATLDHACYLLKKLSTDDSRKALLRLVGDADLPLKIEERAFVVDVMRRHYSKFGDPAHYLENYVKTAGSNSGGNGHFFELQALKKLEDHPFISIEKISVKYDGHEVDLHLKIGDHELLVELKRSLGTMDASRVGAQLNWLGPLCRKNDYGLSVVVSERERIWPGAVEFVEGKGVPVFALDEFLHLTPEQFERLRDDFLAGNGKSGLKGGGDPYTPEDHEDFGISEDPVDDGDFKTEGDGDVLPEISQIIALTDKARRNGLTDEEIGYLVSSLKDADFTVSYWILEALFTLAGKDPGRITPAVVRALETKGLDHPNGWIAGESKKALGRLAKKSPPKIAQEAARALKKTGRGPVNSARVQKSGSVAPGIKAPATAENSALEKAAGTAVAAVLEEALMKGIERWTSGWRTVGREEFKRRLGQIDFNGFWRETRKSHPGLKQVRLALSANLLSGSASAVSFHLPHESLSRCANYTMVDLSFDERGVAVTDVHGPHAYLPLAALFGNSSVRFEPSLLRRAAAAILEEGFMAGRERSLGDWAPMTHAEFLRRWARTDFDSTWRQMKKTRPELERLEGAMTAVTRGKGIIEGVSMIPAGGPLPKGNYLFVHLSFDENGPSATG